jgi:para-aminobenzoate synthetase/4-amino-4-deoxychorismate lyase
MAFEAIIQTPWAGPWRRFANPVEIVQTSDPSRVNACLRRVDERVRGERLFAAGFVAYEAAAAFGLPAASGGSDDLPLLCFGLFRAGTVTTLAEWPDARQHRSGAWIPSIERAQYDSALRHIKERIAAGDTYQINFTFRLTAAFDGDPRSLMRHLSAAQAGEWGAYVETDSHAICSASPELFFTLADGRIVCRPMKGTARRGLYTADDREQALLLQTSDKNRAENVMVVDMVRNDLGRIARYGSVKVASLYDVERFPAHWQMTSEVTADLADAQSTLPGVFEALFPSGSVTGAPKHSSMTIIRSLETGPRGIYTGAIGYVTPEGHAHFNVAIRTVTVDKRRGAAEFGVGSGVVWDSTERDEYAECLLKAAILDAPHNGAHAAAAADFELLETMKWTPAEGFALLGRHLARLADSAGYFGFALSPEKVAAVLATAPRGRTTAARVRLRVSRNGQTACDVSDLPPAPEIVRAAIAAAPIDTRDVFLYHKTTRRGVYEAARASRPDADVVILWNEAREITEATTHNVVVEIGGRRITPPIECGLLPGTLRAELLEAGEIDVGRITVDQLLAATGVWLINSVSGWSRVALT